MELGADATTRGRDADGLFAPTITLDDYIQDNPRPVPTC